MLIPPRCWMLDSCLCCIKRLTSACDRSPDPGFMSELRRSHRKEESFLLGCDAVYSSGRLQQVHICQTVRYHC